MVDIKHVYTRILDKIACIIVFYQNDYLFTQWALDSHIDFRFRFVLTTYDFLNSFNFLVLKAWEGLFDFKCLPSNIGRDR